jgi:hypothetical protein
VLGKLFQKLKKSITPVILIELTLFIIIARLLYIVDFSLDRESEYYHQEHDIYYEYQHAKTLQNGSNPYEKILEGNMLENDKYATQLPLYFYSLAYIRQLSDNEFSDFLENYRLVVYVSHLLGGILIYLFFRRANKRFLGISAAMFYMFNVWSLNSFLNLKQDMPAIALLLLSLYFFNNSKYRCLSYLFFGLSLGIKHIGIFITPLFFMPLLFKEDSFKKFSLNLSILALTLFIPTIPLLSDSPRSFIYSMLFSITRTPLDTEFTYGYNELLVQYDPSYNTGTLIQQLLPRLPLMISSLLVLVLVFFKKISRTVYVFLAILVFAIFNPIIFPQYITWVTPLALVAFSGILDSKDTKGQLSDVSLE